MSRSRATPVVESEEKGNVNFETRSLGESERRLKQFNLEPQFGGVDQRRTTPNFVLTLSIIPFYYPRLVLTNCHDKATDRSSWSALGPIGGLGW